MGPVGSQPSVTNSENPWKSRKSLFKIHAKVSTTRLLVVSRYQNQMQLSKISDGSNRFISHLYRWPPISCGLERLSIFWTFLIFKKQSSDFRVTNFNRRYSAIRTLYSKIDNRLKLYVWNHARNSAFLDRDRFSRATANSQKKLTRLLERSVLKKEKRQRLSSRESCAKMHKNAWKLEKKEFSFPKC